MTAQLWHEHLRFTQTSLKDLWELEKLKLNFFSCELQQKVEIWVIVHGVSGHHLKNLQTGKGDADIMTGKLYLLHRPRSLTRLQSKNLFSRLRPPRSGWFSVTTRNTGETTASNPQILRTLTAWTSSCTALSIKSLLLTERVDKVQSRTHTKPNRVHQDEHTQVTHYLSFSNNLLKHLRCEETRKLSSGIFSSVSLY